MNLASIKTAAKLAGHKNLLLLKKNSPTILMTAGLVGMVTTTVLASKATLKLEPIMDEHEEKVQSAKELRSHVEEVDDNDTIVMHDETLTYTEKDYQRDMVVIHARTATSIAKLYWLPTAVGAVSIAAIVGGHVQLTRRNSAMIAAYTALQTGFTKYRQRVVEEFGVEKDREFNRPKAVLVETEDMKTGEITERFHVDYGDLSGVSTSYFDRTNENWAAQPEYNTMFLRVQQNWANEKLKSWGHLLLNDVHDMLGLPRTQAGQVLGWTFKNGDEVVDFGLDDKIERAHEDSLGLHSILLRFNIQGPVYI